LKMRRGDVMKRRGRGQIDTRRRIGQGRRGERRGEQDGEKAHATHVHDGIGRLNKCVRW